MIIGGWGSESSMDPPSMMSCVTRVLGCARYHVPPPAPLLSRRVSRLVSRRCSVCRPWPLMGRCLCTGVGPRWCPNQCQPHVLSLAHRVQETMRLSPLPCAAAGCAPQLLKLEGLAIGFWRLRVMVRRCTLMACLPSSFTPDCSPPCPTLVTQRVAA